MCAGSKNGNNDDPFGFHLVPEPFGHRALYGAFVLLCEVDPKAATLAALPNAFQRSPMEQRMGAPSQPATLHRWCKEKANAPRNHPC